MQFTNLLRNLKDFQTSLEESLKNLEFWVKKFFQAGFEILRSLGEQTGEKQSFIEIARSE
jgi:hypothetical protein